MANTENTKRTPVGKDISSRRREARARRHFRIRKTLRGTPEAPRLVLHRSSRHMHVQVIDDLAGHTLVSASSMEADVRALEGDKKAKAAKVGELLPSALRPLASSTSYLTAQATSTTAASLRWLTPHVKVV